MVYQDINLPMIVILLTRQTNRINPVALDEQTEQPGGCPIYAILQILRIIIP